jgi:hypothetical protein
MYTTAENIAARLGEALTAEQETYFNDVLSPSIDTYINRYTNTQFGSTDEVDVYVNGEDSSMLVIPTMYGIENLYVVSDDGETLVDSDTYVVYPQGSEQSKYALRNKGGTWSEGFENYKVHGKLGFAEIPDDIVEVATQMAVSGITANVGNYKSEKVGDWAVTYSDTQESLSPDSLSVLASYRRLSRSI